MDLYLIHRHFLGFLSVPSTAILRIIYLYEQTIKSGIITVDNQGNYLSTTYGSILLVFLSFFGPANQLLT